MSNIEEIVSNIEPDAMLELDKILYDIELDEYRDELIKIEENLVKEFPEDFDIKTEADKIKHIECSVDASLSSYLQNNNKNNKTTIDRIMCPDEEFDYISGDYIINGFKLKEAIDELIVQLKDCNKEYIIKLLKEQKIDAIEVSKIENLIDICKQ